MRLYMNYHYFYEQTDHGPDPFVVNIERAAMENQNFRTALWTGCHLQMTLMCIPPCGEIGLEVHENTDQYIRVEQGKAVVKLGKCRNQQDKQEVMCQGDAVFIPAGIWHNIVNAGAVPLKLSSFYAPPEHPWGTVQCAKET